MVLCADSWSFHGSAPDGGLLLIMVLVALCQASFLPVVVFLLDRLLHDVRTDVVGDFEVWCLHPTANRGVCSLGVRMVLNGATRCGFFMVAL